MNDALKQELCQAGYQGEYDLASLMRACGKSFFKLWLATPDNPEWIACSLNPETGHHLGKTPEEAVALLWLALQKHAV